MVVLIKIGFPGAVGIFPRSRAWRAGCVALYGGMSITQTLGTIASRNHYTIDVILAIFVGQVINEKTRQIIQAVMASPRPSHASRAWLVLGLSPCAYIFLKAYQALTWQHSWQTELGRLADFRR